MECFDAREAPSGWTRREFDARSWARAEEHTASPPAMNGAYIEPGLPPLRFWCQPVRSVLGVHATDGPAHVLRGGDGCDAYGSALMAEKWREPVSFSVGGGSMPYMSSSPTMSNVAHPRMKSTISSGRIEAWKPIQPRCKLRRHCM